MMYVVEFLDDLCVGSLLDLDYSRGGDCRSFSSLTVTGK